MASKAPSPKPVRPIEERAIMEAPPANPPVDVRTLPEFDVAMREEAELRNAAGMGIDETIFPAVQARVRRMLAAKATKQETAKA